MKQKKPLQRIFRIILVSSFFVGCSARQPVKTSYLPPRPDFIPVTFCKPEKPGCVEHAALCLSSKELKNLYMRDLSQKTHIIILEEYIKKIQSGDIE